jgi:prepilin-type N-terminal cleavage/methylation domain-containing protein
MNGISSRGFSLLEVLIALGVLSSGVLAMSALMIATAQAGATATQLDVAQLAARAKLEDLRSLAWTSNDGAVPVSDWSTDLTVTPVAATGGPGLGVSPGNTLLANVEGYCDFLDRHGRWIGGGSPPPAGASWVRRWMVRPDFDRPDLLSIQVVVVPVQRSAADTTLPIAQGLNGAWLATLRSRRAR